MSNVKLRFKTQVQVTATAKEIALELYQSKEIGGRVNRYNTATSMKNPKEPIITNLKKVVFADFLFKIIMPLPHWS